MNFTNYRINSISRTFRKFSKDEREAIKIADTIDDARLHRIGYCQTGEELRADYMEYVYDNSFARRRRRWHWHRRH